MADKNNVLESLSRRDAQRLDKLQKAHKARKEVNATNESEDYFTDCFKIKNEYVEDLLTQVPTLDTTDLTSHFNNIKKEISEMQKYVITSSLFLKEFNMRKSLAIIQDLHTKCYELEDRYVPKKKFGFSKKKIPKSAIKLPSTDQLDGLEEKCASKWDEKFFGFDNRVNEVLTLDNEELFQRDISLRHLKHCTVFLKGVLGTLHLTDIEDCIVLSGPVTSSVFVERCTGSKIIVSCQQLRMHSSTNCDIYLHVTCKGIIEDCKDIRTAPYNLNYDDLEMHFNMSSLDKTLNQWDNLDDFNWLAPDVPSPNWSILDKTKRVTCWDDICSKLPS